jgi:adenylylsulfate kinase
VNRVLWIAGRPAAGKTTLAGRVIAVLVGRGIRAAAVDSDEARKALTPRPAYDDRERELVYRALAFAADRLAAAGIVPVVAATAGTTALRAAANQACPGIFWVHARCSREVAAARDPKGLYAAAARGAIARLPGAGAAYEEPAGAYVVDTDAPVSEEAVEALVDAFLAPGAGHSPASGA